MSDEEKREKKRIMEGIEIIVDEAKSAARSAMKRTGEEAESLSENLKETLQGALSDRENVVMVRLNKESLIRLDDLVEADVVNSRSEAAAFLIGEGIKRRQGLFDRIEEKIEDIRKAKEELRTLIEDEESVEEVPEPAEASNGKVDDK